MLGQMLLVGFRGLAVNDQHPIVADIRARHLGGVVLFDWDGPARSSVRNVESPEQLRALTASLQRLGTDLRADFIVSQLVCAPLAKAPAEAVRSDERDDLAILVEKAQGEKCERCWIYSTELGTDAAHPTLCPRCAKVLA